MRVVIDETSFDFGSEPSMERLESHLDRFNQALADLREQDVTVWRPPMFDSAECHDGHGLFEYLEIGPGREIDRDTRYRFYGMVDKCPEWEIELDDLSVAIDDSPPCLALSVALALSSVLRKRGMSCLVFPGCERRGFRPVAGKADTAELYFFASADDLPAFWRSLFRLENVGAAGFFPLAERAFPKLIFHPDLSFSRFRGSYLERRDLVVTHLSALNDEFLAAHQASLGKASDVEIRLRAVGWHGISPESPKTHGNTAAMRKRYVRHDGQAICCEWHTKIMPTHDRIHFAFGGELGDRILIGIFVEHFDV